MHDYDRVVAAAITGAWIMPTLGIALGMAYSQMFFTLCSGALMLLHPEAFEEKKPRLMVVHRL